jgi:hypothetical protein
MRRLLAILFTLAPFVAGAVAALSVRRDVRMLWMALAATIVARVIIGVMGARSQKSRAVAAFVGGTLAAVVVAVVAGAKAVFGVGAVAVVLAGCATIGDILWSGPQSRR